MSGVGVWLIGARGNIAVTTMVGARALAAGEVDETGLVTAQRPCARLDLPAPEEFVFGGHDIRTEPLVDCAKRLRENNGIPTRDHLDVVAADLDAIDDRIRPGTAINCGRAVTRLAAPTTHQEDRAMDELIDALREDYARFAAEFDLDRVIVVNIASTEPPIEATTRYRSLTAVEAAIESDDRTLPASTLYAYAALVDGHPYVNFTPSTGASLGGLRELADKQGVPHMGNDGKTGESLVKSALAPMFAGRNLRVLSWEGHNILGNMDGEVLEDDRNKQGKLRSKGDILEGILPDIEHNRVRIDHTPSLDDRKIAWDLVHFEGFLGTDMTMQFTWDGVDSALAAPLVIDLVRLIAHADAHGERGIQPHLASFFKAPMGVDDHNFVRQLQQLKAYVDRYTGEPVLKSNPTASD